MMCVLARTIAHRSIDLRTAPKRRLDAAFFDLAHDVALAVASDGRSASHGTE